MRRSRLPVALLVSCSLGFTEGCAARAYPRPTVLPPGDFVEIAGRGAQLAVTFSVPDGQFPRGVCRATLIRGYSTGRLGDTISLAWVSLVQAVTPNDTSCVLGEAATVVVPPAAEIKPHNNLSRTAVITIAVVGFAAVILLAVNSKRALDGSY